MNVQDQLLKRFTGQWTIPTPSKRQNATKSKRNKRNRQHEPDSQNQCNKRWRPLAQTSPDYCCNTIPHGYQRQRCRSVGRHLPLSLRLVTLAGNEIETTVPLSIYHHWEMLEDYLVELLANKYGLDTFGCELALLSDEADSPLSDPIHEKIWENNRYQLTVWKSLRVISLKDKSEGKNMRTTPKQSPFR